MYVHEEMGLTLDRQRRIFFFLEEQLSTVTTSLPGSVALNESQMMGSSSGAADSFLAFEMMAV